MLKQAFTLLEVLIVIFVISVLAAWAITNYAPANLRVEDQSAQTQLRVIYAAASSFRVEKNKYPTSLSELITAGQIQDPNVAGNWEYNISGSGTAITITAKGRSRAPRAAGRLWKIEATNGVMKANF